MISIIYTGFFIKGTIPAHLPNPVRNQHITHKFHPNHIPHGLLGKEITVRLTGYAIDGMNEGYKVEFVSGSDAAAEAFSEIKNPHITVSLGEGGIAKNTGDMSFASLLVPSSSVWGITAVYGFYLSDGTVFTG